MSMVAIRRIILAEGVITERTIGLLTDVKRVSHGDDGNGMQKAEKFSFYKDLNEEERRLVRENLREYTFHRGTQVYNGECTGLLYVESGRIRVYTLSETGREISLYRIAEGGICLFSASCALHGVDFHVFAVAETDVRLVLIPAEIYKKLAEKSIAVNGFTSGLMAQRFSEVMWVLDEVLNKKFDARLAALLLEEESYADTADLKITHEQLASHLGTVREAVSRMLKYFEAEGLVELSRGTIRITDAEGLREVSEKQ